MNFSSTQTIKWRLAATLAVFALVAGVTTATRADSPAGGKATEDAPSVFPQAIAAADAAAASAAFKGKFSLLRGSQEPVPASSVIRDPGVDGSAAHEIVPGSAVELARAGATAPEARLWVAPRYDGTQCLLAQPADAQGPAEVCSTVEGAEDGYLLMTQSRSASDVELYGLLPDGVDRVTVGFADGSRTTLPVAENAYAAHFAKPTASIAFTDADGVSHKLVAGIG